MAGSGCTATNNNAAPGASAIFRQDAGAGGATDGSSRADAASNADAQQPDAIKSDANGFDAFINGKPLGYLWFAGAGLGTFLREETTASREKGPGYIVQPMFDTKTFHDLAFDDEGNAWTIPTTGDQILRLPAEQLGRGAIPPRPDVVIHSDALKSPQSLMFDGQGRLWVLNYAASGVSTANVVRFDDVKSKSGPVTLAPSLTLNPDPSAVEQARFNQANAFVLDKDGALWIAAVANVLRLDHAASMAGIVNATSTAVISGGQAYAGLALDGRGNLWVTASGDGYWALRFDNAGALVGNAKPVPSAKVKLPTGTATFAGGMIVDGDGALWVAMSNQLLQFAKAGALTGESSTAPTVVLGLSGLPDLASKLVLWPPLAPPAS